MGFRFRKSKKILPGVRLNFSKKGVGVRFGGKYGGISVGPSGTRYSASIPGTGIYYTEKISSGKSKSKSKSGSKPAPRSAPAPAPAPAPASSRKRPIGLRPWFIVLALLLFFSGLASYSTTVSGAIITVLISIAMLIKTGIDYNAKVSTEEVRPTSPDTK